MIIQLVGPSPGDVRGAGEAVRDLALTWDQSATLTTASSITTAEGTRAIDPIALTALIVSIPSAALAVVDLADRIAKRRRAHELITQAQQLAQQQITVVIVADERHIEVHALDPDHLLELAEREDDRPNS